MHRSPDFVRSTITGARKSGYWLYCNLLSFVGLSRNRTQSNRIESHPSGTFAVADRVTVYRRNVDFIGRARHVRYTGTDIRGIPVYIYTAVFRLRTGNSTSCVFKFPLLQELSDELSTIRKLLVGVATHRSVCNARVGSTLVRVGSITKGRIGVN